MSKRHSHLCHLPGSYYSPVHAHKTCQGWMWKSWSFGRWARRKGGRIPAWCKAASSTAPRTHLPNRWVQGTPHSESQCEISLKARKSEKMLSDRCFSHRSLFHCFPILDTLVVTSDTNIPTCKVPWTWLSLSIASCSSTVITSQTLQTLKTPLRKRHGLKVFC